MDSQAMYELIDSNRRLIEAMGMHWENEMRKQEGKAIAYEEAAFHNLAYRPY